MAHVRMSQKNPVEHRVRLGIARDTIEQRQLRRDVGCCIDDPASSTRWIDDGQTRGRESWLVDTTPTTTAGLRPSAVLSDSEDGHERCGIAHAIDSTQAAFSRETVMSIGAERASCGDDTTSHNSRRSRSATGGCNRLATTTPSIMSATTATRGRPFTRTATVTKSPDRRNDRSTPTMRGGHRNPGAWRPRCRAS